MIANSSILSCNFSSIPLKSPKSSSSPSKSLITFLIKSDCARKPSRTPIFFTNPGIRRLRTRRNSSNTQEPPLASSSSSSSSEGKELRVGGDTGGDGGGEEEEQDWTTSFLLFGFWTGVMYYVFFLAPNQTPATDLYFLKKLLNLKGDDGFEMNQVLVALWYIMGLWPLLYTMLLIPTGRSSKSKIPVWPFVVLSCFGGAYALIPYFVLWRPPAPPVEESELQKWPLSFLESKLTAGITFCAGLALMVYAISSGGDVWKEFYQYFQGSKFIHLTTIDFTLLSTFAPFWVFNDMTARNWNDGKGAWLLPVSLIPLVGPALYLLLRPSLSVAPAASKET